MATNFDAETIRLRIIERLRSKAAWQDILFFSTNSRILDVIAEEEAYLANYDNYVTRENKWSLMRNKSSAIAMTPIHRYKAHRKIGAVGTLRVSLDQDNKSKADWISTTVYHLNDIVAYNSRYYKATGTTTAGVLPSLLTQWTRVNSSISNNIQISQFTVFSNGSDIKFTNIVPFILLAGNDYIDIEVVQGIPTTVTNTALGTENEEFLINDDSIENVNYFTYVNSTEWTSTDSLQLEEKSATKFEIENYLDFTGIYLKFGNNIFGKKLANGDTVQFQYLKTLGSLGNITSINIITTIDSTLTDIANNPVDLFCTNLNELIGGTDIETFDSIKVNSPNTYQTGDRASTKEDYNTIIKNNFSYVAKVITWGVYEQNIDDGLAPWTFVAGEENMVHVSALTTTLSALTSVQQTNIAALLNRFKAPTDIISWELAKVVNVKFNVNAYVKLKNFILSTVRSNINTELNNTYNALYREFYEHIRFSDYQSLIDNVNGVDYHNTTVGFFEDYTLNTTYDTSINTGLLNITPSSIFIYAEDIVNETDPVLIGHDDGAGNLVGDGGIDLTGSAIVYATGVGSLLIDSLSESASNYIIHFHYASSDNDKLLTRRNQIFNYNYDLSVINVSYTTD